MNATLTPDWNLSIYINIYWGEMKFNASFLNMFNTAFSSVTTHSHSAKTPTSTSTTVPITKLKGSRTIRLGDGIVNSAILDAPANYVESIEWRASNGWQDEMRPEFLRITVRDIFTRKKIRLTLEQRTSRASKCHDGRPSKWAISHYLHIAALSPIKSLDLCNTSTVVRRMKFAPKAMTMQDVVIIAESYASITGHLKIGGRPSDITYCKVLLDCFDEVSGDTIVSDKTYSLGHEDDDNATTSPLPNPGIVKDILLVASRCMDTLFESTDESGSSENSTSSD
ncbi:hypothetical protein M422DRAFT_41302 [Sphaerobolus stellatus SS14]|nr:hypothetical protein M422DRAFT_41302 [Sphaerobolus stellatus SS14]